MKHLIAAGGAVSAAVGIGVALAVALPVVGLEEPLRPAVAAIASAVVGALVYRGILDAIEDSPARKTGPESK